jgi:hypothetical protein
VLSNQINLGRISSPSKRYDQKKHPSINTRRRRHFDWILGFGADKLYLGKLQFWLHKFVELVFLREADPEGILPVTHASINDLKPGRSRFLDSVQRAFCMEELLLYTSVITFSMPQRELRPLVQELVFSTPMFQWGIPLPACPNCGNHNVRAVKEQVNGERVTVKCHGCGSQTKGKPINRPQGIQEILGYGNKENRYFWKPMDIISPWLGHKWRPKRRCS